MKRLTRTTLNIIADEVKFCIEAERGLRTSPDPDVIVIADLIDLSGINNSRPRDVLVDASIHGRVARTMIPWARLEPIEVIRHDNLWLLVAHVLNNDVMPKPKPKRPRIQRKAKPQPKSVWDRILSEPDLAERYAEHGVLMGLPDEMVITKNKP